MAGAVLAYLSLYRDDLAGITRKLPQPALQMIGASAAPGPMTRNVTAVTGLLLIVATALAIDETKRFPGWWALLPVAGTYLMIAAGPHTWINNKLLATAGWSPSV